MEEQCPWCKGYFTKMDWPVHEYIESSPGCWKTYCEVLSKEYENYSKTEGIHRLTVDTYAVQHPGTPGKKSTQSVWGHLVSLYCLHELGETSQRAREKLGKFVSRKENWEWLPPPNFENTVNVGDVVKATTIDEHITLVRSWSLSVWTTWSKKYKLRISEEVEKL